MGVEGYRSVIEQTIRGDFSELVVPQEELLVKFGSAVLGKALVPIFMHVTEEKN